jgi:hypothetical protein
LHDNLQLSYLWCGVTEACGGFKDMPGFDVGFGDCFAYSKSLCTCKFVDCEVDGANEACPVSCGTCSEGDFLSIRVSRFTFAFFANKCHHHLTPQAKIAKTAPDF